MQHSVHHLVTCQGVVHLPLTHVGHRRKEPGQETGRGEDKACLTHLPDITEKCTATKLHRSNTKPIMTLTWSMHLLSAAVCSEIWRQWIHHHNCEHLQQMVQVPLLQPWDDTKHCLLCGFTKMKPNPWHTHRDLQLHHKPSPKVMEALSTDTTGIQLSVLHNRDVS